MKWLGLFCNVDEPNRNYELKDLIELLKKEVNLIDLDLQYIWGPPSDILHEFVVRYENYDHVLFVYNGNLWLDSVANQAFWTVVYKNEIVIGHHTKPLIDCFLKSEKNDNDKVVAETLYYFYNTFADKKHKELIEKLKEYF